jgi:hypothetical protein
MRLSHVCCYVQPLILCAWCAGMGVELEGVHVLRCLYGSSIRQCIRQTPCLVFLSDHVPLGLQRACIVCCFFEHTACVQGFADTTSLEKLQGKLQGVGLRVEVHSGRVIWL